MADIFVSDGGDLTDFSAASDAADDTVTVGEATDDGFGPVFFGIDSCGRRGPGDSAFCCGESLRTTATFDEDGDAEEDGTAADVLACKGEPLRRAIADAAAEVLAA